MAEEDALNPEPWALPTTVTGPYRGDARLPFLLQQYMDGSDITQAIYLRVEIMVSFCVAPTSHTTPQIQVTLFHSRVYIYPIDKVLYTLF